MLIAKYLMIGLILATLASLFGRSFKFSILALILILWPLFIILMIYNFIIEG